ncbi:Bug family tripartite tricarboxylate transporter substrate binding protein [Ottowia thiooxydans]|uniref:Bug family tripartite tricarboxylate transporter substrate binding protein n=1 Tax=Ottowia thiooxydans TaxID=219182 RepID=UPI00040392B5|nr:tripartite tricarboxylate transporter substrate binding protein [Ottowia thiooxydans]
MKTSGHFLPTNSEADSQVSAKHDSTSSLSSASAAPRRRAVVRTLGVAIALAAGGMSPALHAQSYPVRPIKIVVPYPPGGPIDALARAFGERLGATLGQPVIIDNKGGANEIIGADAVSKAQPDGYTALLATDASLSLNPFLYSKLPYDPYRDLIPVSRIVDVNMALIVKGGLPVSNLKEFIALMKKDSSKHNYGSSSPGSTTHLSFEALKKAGGFDVKNIPYKGIGPALQDLLAGNIDAMFAGVTAATPYVSSGKLKVLAISGQSRIAALPDVPTFKELGYPDLNAGFYMGVSVPKGTPRAVIDTLSKAIKQISNDKAYVAKYVQPNGYDVLGETPEEFAKFLERDRVVSQQRIKDAGVKLD